MKDPREIFRTLIALRERLGLDEGDNNFVHNPILKQLEGEGIEAPSLDEIEIHPSGILLLDGNPIILYIPDTQKPGFYLRDNELIREGGLDKQPKFHFSWCHKVNQMNEEGRLDRYIFIRNKSGLFKVQAQGEPDFLEDIKLFVCRNCLIKINYKKYKNCLKRKNYKKYEKYKWKKQKKQTDIVRNFDIGEFLEEMDRKLKPFKRIPRHTDKTVRINRYTELFYRMSKMLKEENNWCCSKCGVDMSLKREGLHCHHLNGVKNDNRRKNLQVLCALCHRDIDRHHRRVHVKKNIKEYILRKRANAV